MTGEEKRLVTPTDRVWPDFALRLGTGTRASDPGTPHDSGGYPFKGPHKGPGDGEGPERGGTGRDPPLPLQRIEKSTRG